MSENMPKFDGRKNYARISGDDFIYYIQDGNKFDGQYRFVASCEKPKELAVEKSEEPKLGVFNKVINVLQKPKSHKKKGKTK